MDTILRDAFRESTGREFDEFDIRALDFAAGWRAAMRAGTGQPMPKAAPAPVVYPQGVMGIPPYSPPGAGLAVAKPGILLSADQAVQKIAQLIIEYGDARQAGDPAAVQTAFRALLATLPGAASA